MNSDTVIRQLAEADAYAPEHDLPDSARPRSVALSQIRGSMNMDAEQLTRTPEPKQRNHRGWLVALGAAAVMIVVAGLAIALTRVGGETPPATTPSTTIADVTPGQQAQIDAAIDLIDIYNEGDVTAFSNRFQEAGGFNDFAITGSAVQRAIAFRMGIGEQIEVIECRPGPGVDFQDVVCMVKATDDLGAAEAAPADGDWVFGISDIGRATMVRTPYFARLNRFVVAMGGWMFSEHRDVFDASLDADCGINARTLDCVPSDINMWGLSAEAATVLLQYRDEFLAASTDF